MTHAAIEYLGWGATAVFVGSYFCLRPSLLRGVQMAGALLWVIYGVLINASPVIVAEYPGFFRCGLDDDSRTLSRSDLTADSKERNSTNATAIVPGLP